MYDPFAPGPFAVNSRSVQARDASRDRLFPCEIWYPEAAQPGSHPLILFSHHSGGSRLASTFLCTHLCSHGYVVAALDHSETIATELGRPENETAEQRTARMEAILANRLLDIRFLLDQVLSITEFSLDPDRMGIVGHSLGGWTALATADSELRIRAVVALAPGGASHPKPGIIPAKLSFAWGRDVPTLYLVAENDIATPLEGMYDIFERTPATKQMVILRRADHLHFIDNIEQAHEAARTMTFPPELAWLQQEIRPIAEFCSGEQAHLFVRGLTLCHMDATLRYQQEAQGFLAGDIAAELAARGVDAIVPPTA
ncbi:hypothetical protein SBA3_900022 [Candidatus Sulfopaludibacter sp. SbA3]|nr:hypothetical protein SBA3_900022 [Candidatus Sulfopaludibacter sp. SbA3]